MPPPPLPERRDPPAFVLVFAGAAGAGSGSGAATAFLPVGAAVWTKTRLSQMMGVDCPTPGILTFQRMLLVSLQRNGGLAFGATPIPKGPRHCGQLSEGADAEAVRTDQPNSPRPSSRTLDLNTQSPGCVFKFARLLNFIPRIVKTSPSKRQLFRYEKDSIGVRTRSNSGHCGGLKLSLNPGC